MNLIDLTGKPNSNGKIVAINDSNTGGSYKGPKGAMGEGDTNYDFPALEREAKKVMAKIP